MSPSCAPCRLSACWSPVSTPSPPVSRPTIPHLPRPLLPLSFLSSLQVTGFDIPHQFPQDFQPVFGMDVRHCVEYYQKRFGR